MQVYGADFSGAKDSSKGIYFVEGRLLKRTLHLERVVHCESERTAFNKYLEDSGIPGCETTCKAPSIYCRAVDVVAGAFSPLKKTNPTMRMMTYAGLKLLSYLRRLGHRVYPFDQIDLRASRLYEV